MKKTIKVPQQLLLLVALLAALNTFAQNKKPNIIIVIADDLGWNDVGFHNPEMITPNLDKFAARGVELQRFYVAPICSPTRIGLLTGKYPDRFGLREQVIRPHHVGGLPTAEKTLADVLATAGYKHRAIFGKWHLGQSDKKYHPLNRGFTSFYGHYTGSIDYFTHYRYGAHDWHRNFTPVTETGYSVELVGKEAAKFIRESSAAEPFFAYVAFNGPHSPMQARQQDLLKNGYDASKPHDKMPGDEGEKNKVNGENKIQEGQGNTLRQTYAAMVTGVDDAFGEILKAVEAKGIADNTIIWFLSDNGGSTTFGGSNLPLKGMKGSEWEGGVRAVSVVYWQGQLQGGKKATELMGYVDILPTLSKLAGAKNITATDGTDVLNGLKGKKLPERYLFLGKQGVVSQRWKLNAGQLFDLSKDPSETTDVAKAFPQEYSKMKNALAGFQKLVIPNPLISQPKGWQPPVNWDINQISSQK
ncbi:arylsulfatase [Adhaeribacter aerolatus]|uniref:Arylsulfatase n=1 Tax=Adhaeribacter aerolatus TaxID=670289 RepID=A0A512B2V7_9BACT|nr:arylsulfatase [Adhaeribacter aerolatus]GEO06298.1 arylsulfatase [Adhaeribacter aerolatus]